MTSYESLPIIIIILAVSYVIGISISYWWLKRTKKDLLEKDHIAKQHMYELAILKEISDRTGYSLNIKKILDVISGSLHQFLEYSVVSYMLLEPGKILFKVDIDQPVPPSFVKDIQERMLRSLSALLGRDLKDLKIEEITTGAIMLENTYEEEKDVSKNLVQSYFNIPLVIAGEAVGVLTVAHTKAGLYREEEVEILYKIIAQASSAVTRLVEVVKAEQGKIAAMMESMIEGVVMTDRDYHVVAANPAARAIIGGDVNENLTIFDLIDKFKNTFDFKEKLEEAIKLDKMLTLEGVVLGNKYYQILVSPVKSNIGETKGQTLGGVIIFHDITYEKEAERMRNDFTSMMVHELRSPLSNIKKIGELMKSSKVLEDKEVTQEYVTMLYESSSTMLSLVNDLLDVAKLEAGKFEVSKRPYNLNELALDRIKFYTTAARDTGIDLKFFWDKKISSEVSLDPDRVRQVMNNLLSNAFKYTPKGGFVSVECFLHKAGETVDQESLVLGFPWIQGPTNKTSALLPDSVVVAVTDSGVGITPEDIDKLWNKFTQFVSVVRKGDDNKGSGLGLVIVKGIVEAHGGTVGLGSKVGTGSTFYFTLPL